MNVTQPNSRAIFPTGTSQQTKTAWDATDPAPLVYDSKKNLFLPFEPSVGCIFSKTKPSSSENKKTWKMVKELYSSANLLNLMPKDQSVPLTQKVFTQLKNEYWKSNNPLLSQPLTARDYGDDAEQDNDFASEGEVESVVWEMNLSRQESSPIPGRTASPTTSETKSSENSLSSIDKITTGNPLPKIPRLSFPRKKHDFSQDEFTFRKLFPDDSDGDIESDCSLSGDKKSRPDTPRP